MIWFKTDEGKKSRKTSNKKRKINGYNCNTNKKHGGGGDGNWKKKFKKAIKSPQVLKSIIYVLSEQEKINSSLVAALKEFATLKSKDSAAAAVSSIADAMPATNLKLKITLKDLSFN